MSTATDKAIPTWGEVRRLAGSIWNTFAQRQNMSINELYNDESVIGESGKWEFSNCSELCSGDVVEILASLQITPHDVNVSVYTDVCHYYCGGPSPIDMQIAFNDITTTMYFNGNEYPITSKCTINIKPYADVPEVDIWWCVNVPTMGDLKGNVNAYISCRKAHCYYS